MNTPLVSIVIPVFNRPEPVIEAIDSARRQSAEVSLEIIVVDDGSTDHTWDIVRQLADPVRALRLERNGGQSAARNAGLDLVRGKYVKFLDSDDVLVDGHLLHEVDAARDMQAEIVVSGWGERDAKGRERTTLAPEMTPAVGDSIVDSVLAGKAVPTSSALYVRRSDWRWDPQLRKLDDWDYFVQAALGAARITRVGGIAYWMRDHISPRVTNQATMLLNAQEHHTILGKIERRLESEGRLTGARRRRLAQYYYKELRVLSLHDRAAFEGAVAHILTLDPDFKPRDEERQWWMRLASQVIGVRRAVLTHTAIKRAVTAVSRGDTKR